MKHNGIPLPQARIISKVNLLSQLSVFKIKIKRSLLNILFSCSLCNDNCAEIVFVINNSRSKLTYVHYKEVMSLESRHSRL